MKHDLIRTGDADSFVQIEDGLAYCRRCQQGEIDLEPTCPGRADPPRVQVVAYPHDTEPFGEVTIEVEPYATGYFIRWSDFVAWKARFGL